MIMCVYIVQWLGIICIIFEYKEFGVYFLTSLQKYTSQHCVNMEWCTVEVKKLSLPMLFCLKLCWL